jgi:hypothetical protein
MRHQQAHLLSDVAGLSSPTVTLGVGSTNLRAIRRDGRKEWKNNSGYHVRSLVETTMFRLKTIFGDVLSARLLETQTTQALIRCAALNKMTNLGMPQSYKVA